MRIALYQPEIAGNVGAILRLSACFGVPVDIIEPTGFSMSDARMRRAAMDYADSAVIARHPDWASFIDMTAARLMLLTTKGDTDLYQMAFRPDDILLFGCESAGVPASVAERCTARIRIPIAPTARSLNLAVSAGIALSEALRQTGGLPG